LKETRPLWPPQRGVGLREPNLGKTNPFVSLHYSPAICFAPSLSDSLLFLTLTRLVVVIIFENFSFALFTPPLGDFQGVSQACSRSPLPRHSSTSPARVVAGGSGPRRVSRSSFRLEKCSAPGSPVDPQYLLSTPRCQVTESSDWEAVYSPSYQFSREEDGALKSGSVQSHRRASDVSAAPRLDGLHFPSAPGVNEGGWEVVRPRYWWRRTLKNPERAPRNHQLDVKGTSLFKLKLKGKCYNCLSPAHLAFRCLAPPRCWQCLQSGHRTRYCNQMSTREHSMLLNATLFQPSTLQGVPPTRICC
jgi:hypothetical protein